MTDMKLFGPVSQLGYLTNNIEATARVWTDTSAAAGRHFDRISVLFRVTLIISEGWCTTLSRREPV